MCCNSRAECYLVLISVCCIAMSLMVSTSMFILTYPGDECLLFISVRGEALIYGNPAGCNFMAYGHCFIVVGAFLLLGMLFFGKRKGFMKRTTKDSLSNRTLRGTASRGLGASGPISGNSYPFGGFNLGILPSASMNTLQRKRFARLYSTKVILVCAFLAMFTLVSALVVLSGYMVSCDELHYETRRQIHGRTTLGTPLKQLNIACYSLFRDVDFHSRFHFDHYEYSGQWHGQYRGYQHGRVHHYNTKHKHLIGVAMALEMALGGAWIGSFLWFVLLTMLIYLRCVQKRRRNQELAESIEDARIYASSLDHMQMKPMDQASITSQQSSILSQKPSVVSTNPIVTATSTLSRNGMSSPAPHPQHQGVQQPLQVPFAHQGQIVKNGQMFRSHPNLQQPQGVQPNGVQYVQLANGMLVPVSSIQLQQQQEQLELQQRQMQQMLQQYQLSGAQQQPLPQQGNPYAQLQQAQGVQQRHLQQQPQMTSSPIAQQGQQPPAQYLPQHQQQQLQVPQTVVQQVQQQQQQQVQVHAQYNQHLRAQQQQQQQRQSLPVMEQETVDAMSKHSSGFTINMRKKVVVDELDIKDELDDVEQVPNNKRAQMKQVDLSTDLGMKCSQI